MADRENVIKGLEVCTSIEDGESCPKECPYYQDVCYGYDQLMRDALALLKEQESVVRCKDCVHWIPGEITDKDDFIQPRCRRNGGGWASDDYCSCAERREAACTSNCTS